MEKHRQATAEKIPRAIRTPEEIAERTAMRKAISERVAYDAATLASNKQLNDMLDAWLKKVAIAENQTKSQE